jgi:hypothetical protein
MMKPYVCRPPGLLLATAMLSGLLLPVVAQEQYELPAVFNAADILPPELLAGPNHQLDPQVINDGYMNHYTINSRFGSFQADSTAELEKRVIEVNAIAKIDQVQHSKEFTESMKEGGKNIARGAKNLVTHPVDTVSGAFSGVGKMFKRAGDSLFGDDPPSQSEDERWKNAIGFSKTKREYAAEFGVDVYSSNPVLQQRLDDLSWSGYAGGLTTSAIAMAIPGGVGAAVSVSGTSDMLVEVLRTTPPSDLRQLNREKLQAMEVDATVIDLFLRNSVFTPTQQTLITAALDAMNGTAGRGEFIRFCVLTDSEDVAFFRQRQAQMYAAYHTGVEPVQRFIAIGELAAGLSAEGRLIFAAPLDHLVWTEPVGRFADAVNYRIDTLPDVKSKELRITGTVSALAQQALAARGWQIQQQAQTGLDKKN